jgi:hypothetical protein
MNNTTLNIFIPIVKFRTIKILLSVILIILLAVLCCSCQNNQSVNLSVFDNISVNIQLPDKWEVSEGLHNVAGPFDGLLSINNWGQKDFWAKGVNKLLPDGKSAEEYSPETVLSQMPFRGIYVVLVQINTPGSELSSHPEEYILNDLSGLLKSHDWRTEPQGTRYIDFFKWNKSLRLEIYCKPDASDKEINKLNELLESWRFQEG